MLEIPLHAKVMLARSATVPVISQTHVPRAAIKPAGQPQLYVPGAPCVQVPAPHGLGWHSLISVQFTPLPE